VPVTRTEHPPVTSDVDVPATMWAVARRPRWIAMLALCLVISGIFAWLGHWQIERSVESGQEVNPETETVKVLSDVVDPQSSFFDRVGGQMVTVTGSFAPDDFRVVVDRYNGGDPGSWLIGRLVDDVDGSSVVVALGWSSDEGGAEAAEDAAPTGTVTVTGRYMPSDQPSDGDFRGGRENVVSVPMLVNEWTDLDGDVYSGYVVSADPVDGLAAIDSVAPESDRSLNWLNVFYAIEWVVFAGFAIFLWFRLVRDRFEREVDEAEEARLERATAS
jgi:surfeit locus 1 family protein